MTDDENVFELSPMSPVNETLEERLASILENAKLRLEATGDLMPILEVRMPNQQGIVIGIGGQFGPDSAARREITQAIGRRIREQEGAPPEEVFFTADAYYKKETITPGEPLDDPLKYRQRSLADDPEARECIVIHHQPRWGGIPTVLTCPYQRETSLDPTDPVQHRFSFEEPSVVRGQSSILQAFWRGALAFDD